MIVSALVASTKALKDATLLSLLGFSIFSLIGNQLFSGILQGKCVINPPWEYNLTTNNSCLQNLFKDLGTNFSSQTFGSEVQYK